jgi:hypothetical protein
MSGNPAELPAELGTGGGNGTIDWSRIRGGIGGPNELPAFERLSSAELVREVFRLRDRINVLEGGALSQRLGSQTMSRSFLGGPNELPEGEGGGGGGVFHPRGEIHEIAELPISRFVAEFASLSSRFAQFETTVSKQLTEIQAGLAKQQRGGGG